MTKNKLLAEYFLCMVIATSFLYLSSPVYLLEEDEECKCMWHHEVRDSQLRMRNFGKNLEIDSIASSDHEYQRFTCILCLYEHIRKFRSLHSTPSFVEEDYFPSQFLHMLNNRECLLNSDVLWISMGNWFNQF